MTILTSLVPSYDPSTVTPWGGINSYAGLLTRLIQLIDGEDTSVSTIEKETLDHIINMGERWVYRNVRSRHNEASFSVTVADNLAAIPDDFESVSVVHFGAHSLQPVAEGWLREYNQLNPTQVLYFAEAGPAFTFGAPVEDGCVMQGRYYRRLPVLTAESFAANSLFLAEGDVFIYAALAESGGLFGERNDARVPMWTMKRDQIKDRINLATGRAAYSAGRLQMTTSIQKGKRYTPPAPVTSTSDYADDYFFEDYV
jgi:hypothetical protein